MKFKFITKPTNHKSKCDICKRTMVLVLHGLIGRIQMCDKHYGCYKCAKGPDDNPYSWTCRVKTCGKAFKRHEHLKAHDQLERIVWSGTFTSRSRYEVKGSTTSVDRQPAP